MGYGQSIFLFVLLAWICSGMLCALAFFVATKILYRHDFAAYEYRLLVLKYAMVLGPIATVMGIHGLWSERREGFGGH